MQYRIILISLLLLAGICNAHAQAVKQKTICDKNYEAARAEYDIGNFIRVQELLTPCAEGNRRSGVDVQSRLNALELLTLPDLARDRLDVAKTRIRTILELDPVFIQNTVLRNVVFEELMSAIRTEDMETKVSSVTKKPEDIRLASAHIRLIRRQEIMDRGYLDIVDLLSDIPGFHISRVFGQTYANVYQLGFRQSNPERTLLMVDGVEENGLWSNWAQFSRQYPLSAIKAVEVIYGPAAVMYGPRAFVGAINIITLDPKDLGRDALMPVANPERYKAMQITGNVLNGGFNTKSADLTLQFRGSSENTKLSKFAMQLTGRYYKSDEHNRSSVEFFDYDSSDINLKRFNNYGHMNLRNPVGSNVLNGYASFFNLPATSPYYTIRRDAGGNIQAIDITNEGIKRALALDLKSYRDSVNGAPMGFSGTTENMYLGTKIRIEDLQIGFSIWKLNQPNGIFQDINEAGSANGSIWEPIKATMYMKFEKRFFNGLTLTNLSSLNMQRLGKNTARVSFISFGDPETPLHFAHLLHPDSVLLSMNGLQVQSTQGGSSGQVVINLDASKHGWKNRYMFYQAQQARNETRLFYETRRIDFSGGIDLRSTQTQGDYLIYEDFQTRYSSPAAFRAKQDTVALARERGIVETSSEGGNMYAVFDAGLYTMLNMRFSPSFRASLGTRADLNMIRSSQITMTATPRLALIYYKPGFSVKFTSGSGYQGVSQATRYASGSMGGIPNPNLDPEQIDYADLSIGGRLKARNASGDAPAPLEYDFSAYVYKVTDALGLVAKNDTLYNENIGQFRILGGIASFAWQPSKIFRLDANWTYTLAFQTSNTAAPIGRAQRLLVGDIARNMGNVSATLMAKNLGPFHLSLNLRGNYVGHRPVGPRTTQSMNFGLDSANRGRIPAYLVFHGNLGLALGKFPRFRLDCTVQNLFDRNLLDPARRTYFHPGVGDASGSFNMPWDAPGTPFFDRQVPFVPQRGRFILLKLSINLYASARESKR